MPNLTIIPKRTQVEIALDWWADAYFSGADDLNTVCDTIDRLAFSEEERKEYNERRDMMAESLTATEYLSIPHDSH